MKAKTEPEMNSMLSALLAAFCGLVCGFAPMLVLERFVPVFDNLHLLLFSVYLVFFLSMAFCLGGGLLARRFLHLKRGNNILRLLFVFAGVAISAYWHLYLDPVPVAPALEGGVYFPILLLAAIFLLAWLPFLFVLKKFF